MKRTEYTRRHHSIGGWWRMLTLALAVGLSTSCDTEERGDVTSLPDGKYPLQLTAELVQPQTRSAGKDAWTGSEAIAVRMDDTTGKYVVDVTGAATPATAADALFWQSTADAEVTAWYPYTDGGTVGYDISDQSGGYAGYDFLRATATGRYNQSVSLRFHHQMAKMEVTLNAGDGITAAELAGADVVLFGDACASVTDGMVADAARYDDEIFPYKYDAKKYEAVVVPQNMKGKKLVQVGFGGKTFVYTPETDAAGNLEAGKRYKYTITVKANGIEVAETTGGSWSDGGEENVLGFVTYKDTDLKIGDYFYSDGSWSDGGLRKIHTDSSMEMAAEKPAPVLTNPTTGDARTIVGIVFQTDPDRIGTKEKEKLGGNAHGLVMSVKNAATGQKWGPYGTDEDLTKCLTKSDTYKDISGYGNCEHIRDKRKGFDNYPAFKAADGYNASCPVPASTTGWYLPSSGQLWDILRNLGGCPSLAEAAQQSSSAGGDFTWAGQGDVPAALNAWMQKIAAGGKDVFGSNVWLWSSSEYSSDHARDWGVYSDGRVYCNRDVRGFGHGVRPVLAF